METDVITKAYNELGIADTIGNLVQSLELQETQTEQDHKDARHVDEASGSDQVSSTLRKRKPNKNYHFIEGPRIEYHSSISPTQELSFNSYDEFTQAFKKLCNNLYQVLGPRYLESTYQNAMKIDLEKLNIKVESELSLPIMYDGEIISSRRLDLLLELPDKDKTKVIVELKAVASLQKKYLQQLKYYMAHFKVANGILVNFVHEDGFPDDHEVSFDPEIILQGNGISDKTPASPRKIEKGVDIAIVKSSVL